MTHSETNTVLHINASARYEGSISRDLTASVIEHLSPTRIIVRDLTTAIPQINETWVGANFTPEDARHASPARGLVRL